MAKKTAVIIGAGPAGLTAAYELLQRSDYRPLVLEMSSYMGGLARTVNYKGNRIDIGGHRFFSKSDRVMDWWQAIMPLAGQPGGARTISYQGSSRSIDVGQGPDPETVDRVMLLRPRKSRIYYSRQFFDYPVRLDVATLRKLGMLPSVRIGLSYLKSVAFPLPEENNLEQFFINRFGAELYRTFFKSYTEKVWGVSCREIPAEWGVQRIKGLSILRALQHAARNLLGNGVQSRNTETSLIEEFLYPKLGPGQMWELVAEEVQAAGGEILTGQKVDRLVVEGGRVVAVEAIDLASGERRSFEAELAFSTMPVKELVPSFSCQVPPDMQEIAAGLCYRDFITVGVLLSQLRVPLLQDNWIYIQEPGVQVGRVQVFNNWSPYLVQDPSTSWLGLEYFCNEGDALWNLDDRATIALAGRELERIGLIERRHMIDATVIRMPKTYPAYLGSYQRFEQLRRWIDGFENLFLIGRNGMHRYNNQDHSMLAAMVAVDNILAGRTDKANIWQVNAEADYHEEK